MSNYTLRLRRKTKYSLSIEGSHAAFGYMSNYTLRLRRKTKYSPQVEGVKMPSEGCAGAFKYKHAVA